MTISMNLEVRWYVLLFYSAKTWYLEPKRNGNNQHLLRDILQRQEIWCKPSMALFSSRQKDIEKFGREVVTCSTLWKLPQGWCETAIFLQAHASCKQLKYTQQVYGGAFDPLKRNSQFYRAVSLPVLLPLTPCVLLNWGLGKTTGHSVLLPAAQYQAPIEFRDPFRFCSAPELTLVFCVCCPCGRAGPDPQRTGPTLGRPLWPYSGGRALGSPGAGAWAGVKWPCGWPKIGEANGLSLRAAPRSRLSHLDELGPC